jgi:hypothetical protein
MQIQGLHRNIYKLYSYSKTPETIEKYKNLYFKSIEIYEKCSCAAVEASEESSSASVDQGGQRSYFKNSSRKSHLWKGENRGYHEERLWFKAERKAPWGGSWSDWWRVDWWQNLLQQLGPSENAFSKATLSPGLSRNLNTWQSRKTDLFSSIFSPGIGNRS